MTEPSRHDRLMAILSGADRRLRARMARAVLSALTPAYSAGLHVHMGLFRAGILRRTSFPCAVVSIGNLTTGGTGKTGMTVLLAKMLEGMGLRPAVLAHGYRASGAHARVVSDGHSVLLPAAEAGDEASMLARLLPNVPIVIGRRRTESGLLALSQFAPDVMILDDGFQYWRLRRDLDIVLLDAVEPFGFGHLLPRGLLREPLHHLARADAIVLTQCDRAGPQKVAAVRHAVTKLAPGKPVWTAHYEPAGLTNLRSGEKEPMSRLRGARAAALSSIAVPQAFEDTLRALGVSDVLPFRFPDHYPYTVDDAAVVLQHARSIWADVVVTTEKDAVKLGPVLAGAEASAAPGQHPDVLVLSVRTAVDDEEGFAKFVAEALGRKHM